jgi:hypothetical protein
MRIKLFESFTTDDYYKKLNYEEYQELYNFYDNKEAFNKNEVNFFNNLTGDKIRIDFWRKQKKHTSVRTSSFDDSDEVALCILNKYIYVNLTKLKDNYYIVNFYAGGRYTSEYYRCDQFDGLLKLLKDKK